MAQSVRCCCWLLVLTLVALGITAAVVFVRHKNGGGGVPGSVDPKYAEALAVALQFFQVQKCTHMIQSNSSRFSRVFIIHLNGISLLNYIAGKLVKNEIPWRGDSAVDDGQEAGLDLSKGMYDAGDHIKFGFPMAFTATMLSWSVIEFGDLMPPAERRHAVAAVRWATDYLLKTIAHPGVLFIQASYTHAHCISIPCCHCHVEAEYI